MQYVHFYRSRVNPWEHMLLLFLAAKYVLDCMEQIPVFHLISILMSHNVMVQILYCIGLDCTRYLQLYVLSDHVVLFCIICTYSHDSILSTITHDVI